MSDGSEKPKFEMPPPPKPLSFQMPKPPVLNPPIAPMHTNQTTVIPNPFAPRPNSISPRPQKKEEQSENSEKLSEKLLKKEEPEKIQEGSEKSIDHENPENSQKSTENENTSTVESHEKPKNPEKSINPEKSKIPENALTTEIPITPMVEEHKMMTSPALLEVSSHVDSSRDAQSSMKMLNERVDMSGGLMSWLTKTVAESKLLSDVAEKAKAGMETVITTLDPGMKPFLAEHGVIEFALFNSDTETLSVASEAFTKAGAMAISKLMKFDETTELVNFRPLVEGDIKARKLCDLKIEAAKKSKKVAEDSAIVVVQPFLIEISGKHYSTSKIALHHQNMTFDAISQLLEVPETIVEAIQRAAKSEGLPENEFSITVTQAIKNVYKSSVSSWEPGSLPPYDSHELLAIAFSSVTQQLLRHLAPVN